MGTFPDVPADTWYTEAVAWAKDAGIALGNEDGPFTPDWYVSRAQLAAFLYRYASLLGRGTENGEQPVPDLQANNVAPYAWGPLTWAISNGLYKGFVFGDILPDYPVSRAQFAEALTVFLGLTDEEPLAKEITSAISAPVQAASASLAHHDEIQNLVNSVASKYGAVGLQVAVVEDGKVTDSFACGWAVKDSVPMTTGHKIRVASISKVMVGLGTMLLREQGVIGLDDDIGIYWGTGFRNPYYPDAPVTFSSLLSHTSSIRALDGCSLTRGSIQSKLGSSAGYSINGAIKYRPIHKMILRRSACRTAASRTWLI